jgi:mono/diheme cytochrome c family protein
LLLATAAPSAASSAESTYPRQRPLTDRHFEQTPARLERGRYLAEHLLQCFICHSERDWTLPGAPPLPARKGAGAVLSDTGGRRIVAPNITPDIPTGAGSWTDDMLARAIREGIGHDGRPLFWGMWYQSFIALSDEDLAGVIVYLRSLPPVRNALPRTLLPPDELARIEKMPRPVTAPVHGPAPGDTLALGRYLVTVADCGGCHTSWHSARNPGLLGGGNEIARGARRAFSSNLTRHASGIAYGRDAFIAVIRGGKAGSLSPLMPWAAFRGLSDADLGAIYDALGTVEPVAHYVGNLGEPRHCAVCGQQHPLGEYNSIVPPAPAAVASETLARLAGRYRSAELEWTIDVRHEAGRLFAREPGAPEIELVPQTATRFLAPGWLAPLEFELAAAGPAARLRSMEIEPVVLERVP